MSFILSPATSSYHPRTPFALHSCLVGTSLRLRMTRTFSTLLARCSPSSPSSSCHGPAHPPHRTRILHRPAQLLHIPSPSCGLDWHICLLFLGFLSWWAAIMFHSPDSLCGIPFACIYVTSSLFLFCYGRSIAVHTSSARSSNSNCIYSNWTVYLTVRFDEQPSALSCP